MGEVRHLEPQKGQHVLLTIRGCTSCVNEITKTVEGGGCATVNENGEYHSTKSVNPLTLVSKALSHSEQIVLVRSSYNCLKSRNACKHDESYHTWKDATYLGEKVGNPNLHQEKEASKYVKRATYLFSSFKGDTVIEPLLEEIRTTKGQERKAKLEQLGTELRHEEKHVPFNHELEQLHIELRVCTETGSGLKCEMEASEELVVHDAAVLGGSAQTTMLDQLGNGDRCSYGACPPGSMMTECLANQCQSPSRFQRKNQQSDLCYASQVEGFENGDKYGPPRGGAFSCIKETAQGHDTPIVSGRVGTEGLFFRTGTQSKAHVTGHMQWHVTVPSPGTCVPELGDGLYIGMGVSEADACLPNGPDLDLGVLFFTNAHQVFGNKEISDAHRLAHADPLTKLSTGHPETVGGQAPVILDALEQQQVNAFEGERHNSDSSDASTAKHMSEEHFYQHSLQAPVRTYFCLAYRPGSRQIVCGRLK